MVVMKATPSIIFRRQIRNRGHVAIPVEPAAAPVSELIRATSALYKILALLAQQQTIINRKVDALTNMGKKLRFHYGGTGGASCRNSDTRPAAQRDQGTGCRPGKVLRTSSFNES